MVEVSTLGCTHRKSLTARAALGRQLALCVSGAGDGVIGRVSGPEDTVKREGKDGHRGAVDSTTPTLPSPR